MNQSQKLEQKSWWENLDMVEARDAVAEQKTILAQIERLVKADEIDIDGFVYLAHKLSEQHGRMVEAYIKASLGGASDQPEDAREGL